MKLKTIILFAIVLAFMSGCDGGNHRTQQRIGYTKAHGARAEPFAPAIQATIDAAIGAMTPDSIRQPRAAVAILWEYASPRLDVWYIEDHPTVDGAIVRYDTNQAGTLLKVPDYLRPLDGEGMLYQMPIPLQQYLDKGLLLPKFPATSIEVALARDGKAVSPFIRCNVVKPGPSTAPASIGAGGRAISKIGTSRP